MRVVQSSDEVGSVPRLLGDRVDTRAVRVRTACLALVRQRRQGRGGLVTELPAADRFAGLGHRHVNRMSGAPSSDRIVATCLECAPVASHVWTVPGSATDIMLTPWTSIG